MIKSPLAAILISRQSLHPTGFSSWVKASVEAMLWLKKQGCIVLTSVGMQTWELLLFLAIKYSIPQSIIIPSKNEYEFIQKCTYYKKQFPINESITRFQYIQNNQNTQNGFILRDEYIFREAHILIPISIKDKGTMTTRLLSAMASGKNIQNKFVISYEKRNNKNKQKYCFKNVQTQGIASCSEFIFHWTRTSKGPWPTETLFKYYSDIINSKTYPRSAFFSLGNILSLKQIVASTRHMPSYTACVSFTGKTPAEFVPHMRWRARYSEMAFEPYGIGIRRSIAETIGICKVLYIDTKVKSNHPDRWRMQTAGTKGDWLSEDEYRCQGDCSLTRLNKKDIIVICKTPQEAQKLQFKYKYKTLALFNV